MSRIILGRRMQWLVLLSAAVFLAFAGRAAMHVRQFPFFVLSLLGLTFALILLFVFIGRYIRSSGPEKTAGSDD